MEESERDLLMAFYSNYILPRVINWAMNDKHLMPLRAELLASTYGEVAEIGFGTGANLPFYPKAVESLIGIESSQEILNLAKKRLGSFSGKFIPIVASAVKIPLPKHSVDFVVSTFTLCSVSSTLSVLREARRILKPGGTFLFLEHGLAVDLPVQKWQRRLTPLQKRLAGGCHLDRNILGLLADACMDVPKSKRFYVAGIPKPLGYVTMGEAE